MDLLQYVQKIINKKAKNKDIVQDKKKKLHKIAKLAAFRIPPC
jgi:hypothetical protein